MNDMEQLLKASVTIDQQKKLIAQLTDTNAFLRARLRVTEIKLLRRMQAEAGVTPLLRDQDNRDEAAYDRQQQSLMDGDHLKVQVKEDQQLRDAGRGHLVKG